MIDSGHLCPACSTPVPAGVRSCPSCGALSLPGPGDDATQALLARLAGALSQRYRIERELGRGGMALVFLARDLRHGRPVAIKVLVPELSLALGPERFLREIHIAAQLNHPHIVVLHDSGEADGLLFYVMPYVEGGSLRGPLKAGPLSVAEAVRIAGEVADGLAYAHERGVVHRDIKPENILLTHGHATIADFGIARAVSAAGSGTSITTTGVSMGTPIYMSPEQAAGDQTLDHRADIYSLGCVLHEMLTGQPPYPGPTQQALLVQHVSNPVPSARAARADVPEALDLAVRRALAKSPEDRFQSAREMRAAVAVTPPAGPAAPARRARFRPVHALVAGAVLLALLGGALLLKRPQSSATSGTPRPRPRVVVRTFSDRTGREGAAALRITEALTRRLQRVPGLDLVAFSLISELHSVSLDSLIARFHPDRVVMGQLAEAPGGLTVTAQVVNPHTGTAQRPDSSVTVHADAGAAESAAEALSVFVRHVLWSEIEQEARRSRVKDAETWALVESARERRSDARSAIELRSDGQGFRSLDAADSLLRLALQRDAGSDLIPIELASISDTRAFYLEYLAQALRNMPPNLPSPVEARRRALAVLEPLIRSRHGPADAYELRGRIREGLQRQLHDDSLLDSAIADLRAATELDPHLASAWRELGSAYLSAGLYDDALYATQHAMDEDAFQLNRELLLRTRFDAALRAGRFDIAGQACQAGLTEWPGEDTFLDCDLQLWSQTRGDRRSAAAARARADSLALGTAERMPIERPLRELWIAEILARAGLGDSADAVARRAVAGTPPAWRSIFLLEEAKLRVVRNQPDSALALIATAVRENPTARASIRSAYWFAPLRADPRFSTLVGGR